MATLVSLALALALESATSVAPLKLLILAIADFHGRIDFLPGNISNSFSGPTSIVDSVDVGMMRTNIESLSAATRNNDVVPDGVLDSKCWRCEAN